MIKSILKGVFLWRRNNVPSIIFKMAVFAALSWFIVNMFLSNQMASVAAGVAALIALIKYSLQARRESAALLKAAGGDKEKVAALKKMVNQGGMGGALMSEMLRSELDVDDDDDYEEIELTAEQRQEHVTGSQANLDNILAVVEAYPDVTIEDRDVRITELREEFAAGDCMSETNEILVQLLPERALSFCYEGYCNDGDHAGLVEEIATASAGAWTPTNIESNIDEETEKCTVRFMDNGTEELWRFTQDSDWVNENFLKKLLGHARKQGGVEIVALDTEDFFEAIVLPPGFYAQLNNEDQQAAA